MLYGMSFPAPQEEDHLVPLGQAKIVREGRDVTLVTFSLMVKVALEAADQLAEKGIETEVIDLRTLRPLDTQTILRSLKKTNRLVSLEEGWPFAGIGSEIAAVIMEEGFDDLDAPVLRITGADVPMPYADNLAQLTLPCKNRVVEAIQKVCYRQG